MEIRYHTGSYNSRRYSKPWIARVDFSHNKQGDFQWGEWVGDHHIGSEGILIVQAQDGDIVAIGQKDFRKPRNSAPEWYQVRDGHLAPLSGKYEAYQLATAKEEI